jgi:hypothetical protein
MFAMARETVFVPQEPSIRVQAFLKENSSANWRDGITFLLGNYPQVVGDKIQWILDGSAAVKLYFPERDDPGDLDMVARNNDFVSEFSNSKLYDAKTIKYWLESRGFLFTEETAELVLESNELVKFDGRELLVMDHVMLAVSKTISSHQNIPRRVKDTSDLELMRVNPVRIQEMIKKLSIN